VIHPAATTGDRIVLVLVVGLVLELLF